MRLEDILELEDDAQLSSEIVDDNLLERAIAGTMAAGVVTVPHLCEELNELILAEHNCDEDEVIDACYDAIPLIYCLTRTAFQPFSRTGKALSAAYVLLNPWLHRLSISHDEKWVDLMIRRGHSQWTPRAIFLARQSVSTDIIKWHLQQTEQL